VTYNFDCHIEAEELKSTGSSKSGNMSEMVNGDYYKTRGVLLLQTTPRKC